MNSDDNFKLGLPVNSIIAQLLASVYLFEYYIYVQISRPACNDQPQRKLTECLLFAFLLS